MINRKKVIMMLGTAMVTALICLNPNIVQAEQKSKTTVKEVLPRITFVKADHSPIIEEENIGFLIISNCDTNVQYSVQLYTEKTKKWEDISKGYSKPLNGKEVYKVNYPKKLKAGNYKLSVLIKKQGSKNKYDSNYSLDVKCLPKSDKILTTNGDMNVIKNSYVLGESIDVYGISNLPKNQQPYKYKLDVYNVKNNKWEIDKNDWQLNNSWIPKQEGSYILDLKVLSPGSKSKVDGEKIKFITIEKSKTIATVNGKQISSLELANKMKSIFNELRYAYGANYSENKECIDILKQQRENVLNELIKNYVMMEQFDKLKLTITKDELNNNINENKKQFKDDKECKRVLNENGLNEKTYIELIKQMLKEQKVFEAITKDTKISEEQVKKYYDEKELKKYYDENPYKFTEKTNTMEVAHILVKTEQEAIDIKKRIDNGEDFATLAKEKSTCPSKKDGGNLGIIEYAQDNYDKDFLKGAIEVADGKVSNPVKTQFGYHLIKVTNKKEYPVVNFDKVIEKINNDCLNKEKETMWKNYQEKSVKESKVVINKEL